MRSRIPMTSWPSTGRQRDLSGTATFTAKCSLFPYRRGLIVPGRNYNGAGTSMQTGAVESIPITLGREDDGRWWADIESMPGVMAYGETRQSAIAAVRALALRVAADCIDHGEEVPEPLAKVFSVA